MKSESNCVAVRAGASVSSSVAASWFDAGSAGGASSVPASPKEKTSAPGLESGLRVDVGSAVAIPSSKKSKASAFDGAISLGFASGGSVESAGACSGSRASSARTRSTKAWASKGFAT